MSKAGQVDVVSVVTRYAAGWFPLFDERERFFWERPEQRAIMRVDEETLGHARRMSRRGGKRFEIRFTTAVEAVLEDLQTVRENSWVKGEVVEIYRALHAAGLLRTVEAWEVAEIRNSKSENVIPKQEKLVGGLLGIVLPGVFVAETMYGLASEASKVCLCRLVEECAAGGFEVIDVQMAHDEDPDGTPRDGSHPCVRLGEERMDLEEFLGLVEGAWRRRFDGGAKEWVAWAQRQQVRELHGLWAVEGEP